LTKNSNLSMTTLVSLPINNEVLLPFQIKQKKKSFTSASINKSKKKDLGTNPRWIIEPTYVAGECIFYQRLTSLPFIRPNRRWKTVSIHLNRLFLSSVKEIRKFSNKTFSCTKLFPTKKIEKFCNYFCNFNHSSKNELSDRKLQNFRKLCLDETV